MIKMIKVIKVPLTTCTVSATASSSNNLKDMSEDSTSYPAKGEAKFSKAVVNVKVNADVTTEQDLQKNL